MSKQQMIGAVGAGVFTLCAGGLGYMLWDAWSVRTEQEEELEAQAGQFQNFYQAKVFPSKKSIADVQSNETAYATWLAAARQAAARGDVALPQESAPVFKQRLQQEVSRMVALPGGLNGKIAEPTFLFGFDPFLGENGTLPKDEEVPQLAAQLDAITRVTDVLADAGVLQVTAVTRRAPAVEDEKAEKARKGKAKKAKAAAEPERKTTVFAFDFAFNARPAALVTVLNRLTASPRFFSITGFSFKESADTIVERLGAVESALQQAKEAASGAGRGRRGRRGRGLAAEAEQKKEPVVDALVTDPETDAPLAVTLTVTVHDFGCGVAQSAAQPAAAAPAPAEAAKKPEANSKSAEAAQSAAAPAKKEGTK